MLSQLSDFNRKDESYQQVLLDIAVLTIVDLSKNKKNKSIYEKFRENIFAIIRTITKDASSGDSCILKTLPAFSTIIKANMNPEKGKNATEEDTQLVKLFLKSTVSTPFRYFII